MRWIGALAVCTLALGLASQAVAAGADDTRQALFGAAFATSGLSAASGLAGLSANGSTARYIPGLGLAQRTSTEVSGFAAAGARHVDSVRIVSTGYDPRPGLALTRPGAGGFNPEDVDLTYLRHWPSIVSVDAGGNLSLDITPHAGLGVRSSGGRSAEAGALVRFGAGLQDRVMRAVGMRGAPEQRTKLYLFAGATAWAMERNLTPGDGAVRRSTLPEDGYVQESRAGLGLGRGAVQALIGYTRETTKLRSLGEDSRSDSRVGLTLSIH